MSYLNFEELKGRPKRAMSLTGKRRTVKTWFVCQTFHLGRIETAEQVHQVLGGVVWGGPSMPCYCFDPMPSVSLNASQLKGIASFCAKETRKHHGIR